jgi:hypothetical protein
MSKNKAYHERRKAKKMQKRINNELYGEQLKLPIAMPASIHPIAYSLTGEKTVKNAFEQHYISLAKESGANTKDREALIEIGQTIERAA